MVFFKKGKYKVHPTYRLVYRNDVKTIKYLDEKFFTNNPNLKSKIKTVKGFFREKIFSRKIKLKSNSVGDCTILFLTNNRISKKKDLKFFDLTNNKTIFKTSNSKIYHLEKNNFFHFKDYFPLINTCFFDEDNIIEEELVDIVPKLYWNKDKYEYILNNLFKYYEDYYHKNNEFESVEIKSFLDEINKTNYMIPFIEDVNLKINLKNNLCLFKHHGDLSSSNILLTNSNDIKIIDWTYSDYYFVGNDIFEFIHLSSINDNQMWLLENYITGVYDEQFEKLYKSAGTLYVPEKRLDYLNTYIYENMLRKNKGEEVSVINHYIREYKRFIEFYNSILKENYN